MDPNSQWHYADANGTQQGPFSLSQLQQMAAGGQIQPTTMVWTEGLADWTPASAVQGLLPAQAPVVAAANPYQAPGAHQAPGTGTGQAGDYPIPAVKKTSFALFLAPYIAGVVLLLVAMAMVSMAARSSSESDPSELNLQHAGAGTPDEIQKADNLLNEAKDPEYTNAEVAGGLTLMLCFGLAWGASVFGAIYAYIILYRAWFCLQPGGARTTPSAAVGFMFIPIYNIYWIFNVLPGWATDWNRIRASYPNLRAAPPASGGLFLAGLICMLTVVAAPIGVVCLIIAYKQMCDVINFMANARATAAMAQPGAMPSFY